VIEEIPSIPQKFFFLDCAFNVAASISMTFEADKFKMPFHRSDAVFQRKLMSRLR